MDRWLDDPPAPTAVFAENDLMAIGVLGSAHAAGLTVPDDLSVISFDGIGFGADVTPPLTTVGQSTDEVAAAAIELLFERLRDAHAAPRLVELPVSLVLRGSSGPPPVR